MQGEPGQAVRVRRVGPGKERDPGPVHLADQPDLGGEELGPEPEVVPGEGDAEPGQADAVRRRVDGPVPADRVREEREPRVVADGRVGEGRPRPGLDERRAVPRPAVGEHLEQAGRPRGVVVGVGPDLEPPPGHVPGPADLPGRQPGREFVLEPLRVGRAPDGDVRQVLDAPEPGRRRRRDRHPGRDVADDRELLLTGLVDDRGERLGRQVRVDLDEVLARVLRLPDGLPGLVRGGHGPDVLADEPRERGPGAVDERVRPDDPRPAGVRVDGPGGPDRVERVDREHVPDAGHPGRDEERFHPRVGDVGVHVPEAGDEILPAAVDDDGPGRPGIPVGSDDGRDRVAADDDRPVGDDPAGDGIDDVHPLDHDDGVGRRVAGGQDEAEHEEGGVHGRILLKAGQRRHPNG